MKRLACVAAVFGVLASFSALEGLVWPPPSRVDLNGHTFTLPAGFTIELAAGPPLVDRPITADFDEQGRLYVAESSGTNENVQEQLKKKPHRILRLVDTNGDGQFDQRTVFADQMMFPEGTLWHAGSLYVAAPPSIWKLTDSDGDGVADERVEWFQGKTLTGCANDLHGPYLGPDGWIYWCKGAFAKQTHHLTPFPLSGGQGRGEEVRTFETRASHIFRCRPDGTGIEPVMTGGMDNPVDVVFTPSGERIFTTTFFQHPGGGLRDGLIHAVYGGIYGKDHDVIHDPIHKWTSPTLMPVLTHMGAAAPCGLTRYESAAFGVADQDSLFACQFNLHKVSRHELIPEGATFQTRDQDFLVSNNLDFHPTDVLEDADGSLLVVDTGGWYKLCCPTSQLHKPDVLGAIYRVRRQGAPKIEDPRGLQLRWSELDDRKLASLLTDPRPVVRRRAMERLARLEFLPALVSAATSSPAVEARRNAVWASTRVDAPEARKAIRTALEDPDETVRQVALHSISLWRDAAAASAVMKVLHSSSAHNRRAAAEALGRIGDRSAVPALLAALAQPNGRVLEHSLIYALIEIGDRAGTAEGLLSTNPAVHHGCLIALDQMENGTLDVRSVAEELSSSDTALKEAAWWIASRHPEWGEALAGVLRARLTAKDLPPGEQEELADQLARLARGAAIQQLLAEGLRDPASPPQAKQIILRAMAQAGLKQTPEAWFVSLKHLIGSANGELLASALSTARVLPMPKQAPKELVDALLQLGAKGSLSPSLRLQALAAVPGGLAKVNDEAFALLRSQLLPEQPVTQRSLAVDVLGRSQLTSEQLLQLTADLKVVGPMEIDRLLEAFARSSDDRVGQALVAALQSAPALAALRTDMLKPRLAKYGQAVQQEAERLYNLLNVDAAQERAKLDQLLAGMNGGDIRRGQLIFNGTKAACASCHAVGYLGGKSGPDLTHIARTRTERDLLEAIVFPSASFVRSYEPIVVLTHDGRTLNGILKRDAPEEIVLTLTADQEARIPRDEIAAMKPSKTSIMPAGLDQQLTPQDLADLLAFLKACK
jgi:putative membrane-bound dehydrogenase-like protein